ncbi:Arc family DNA-binding protein [uncultured Pseudomonas sp.]|uniref:Arc family DNA-binding protein n=1 Tax=uncultured Pseudomonas sp. TaxID=114707 RepID=UPI0025E0E0A5|nr:Arc family DNA-binding protein [uncultured Pseudomonas sp.]
MKAVPKRKPRQKRTDTETESFQLRLPMGMRARIDAAAKDAHRSMNSEIVDRLERTFQLQTELQRLYQVIDHLLAATDQPSQRPLLQAVGERRA